MRFRKPSPAMCVAITALVMASTGTAVAAVNYARKAGAVDSFSAVGAGSTKARAAGKLIATRRSSSVSAGQIPNKFLGKVPAVTTYGKFTQVGDNAAGAAQPLHDGVLGALSATCNDQAGAAGREDPTTTVSFANTTPNTVSLARAVEGQSRAVDTVAGGTQHSFTINGSNLFRVHIEYFGANVVYEGHVRQDGRGTADGSCLIVGTAETFTP